MSPTRHFLFCIKLSDFFSPITVFSFPLFQLGISSHENATPVKLVHNSAGHLNGPARTVGAALIGYLGQLNLLFHTFLFAFQFASTSSFEG